MAFYKKLLSLSAVLLLASCAYAVESSNQDITFLTPDAQDAKCYVYANKLKYQVFPPQSLNIKKSPEDMEITCHAPGNRYIEMTVPAQMSERAVWGGPAGMAWDYASQSLYYYPSVIAIDFSNEKVKPNPLPSHNNSDITQPETYDLEEFRPSQPRMNADKYKVELPIIRRGEEVPSDYAPQAVSNDDKANLQSVLDDLTETPSSKEAVSAPVQIYAGE